MKPYQLAELSYEELKARLIEDEEELTNLRFQLATKKEITNVRRIRRIKREIAQLKTVLREHELGLRKLRSGPQSQELKENAGESSGKKED